MKSSLITDFVNINLYLIVLKLKYFYKNINKGY